MSLPSIQTSFNAGEIAPELYGEVSLAKYGSAATTLRNFVVNYRGGAISRGGLALVGRCKQAVSGTGPPRPIPFSFNITQAYILEFGDNYLRFVFQGGYVLENPVNIVAATQDDPIQITVTGTPFANGDWIFASNVGGMMQLNGNTYIVNNVAGDMFTLLDLNGNSVDATNFNPFTGGGTFARLYTLATPYAASDLPYLKFSQSADVMSLTLSNPTNLKEYPPYDLVRNGAIDWVLTETNFDAVIAPPASVNAAANAQAPTTGINATFSYQVTAVDKKGNESLASAIATCHGADLEVEAGTNTLTWTAVTGAAFYNVYRAPPAVDSGLVQNPVPAGSIYGFVGSAFGTQFLDTQSVADLSQTPPTHQNPFACGEILSVDITDGGSGLTTVTYDITTLDGTGFAGYPVVAGGALGAFPITAHGENFAPGDSVAFNGAGNATGAIDFATNPAPADTITLNGVLWTFVGTITAPNQTLIQGSLASTLATLVANLFSSTNPSLTVANYAVDSTNKNLLIQYKTAGVGGDAYTLAASAATPSGGTLTGGAGSGGVAPSATLNIGPTTGTYPGVNAYFQQRRFYANSLNDPDTFWASQTGLFQNFDTRIPSEATDAITASPWTEQVDGIQWLISMPGGLIAMTGNRAWQIVGEGSYQLNVQPITPSTTQAQPQAFNGCSATVPPIVVDYDVLYIEAIGNTTARDLSWNFWINIYTGADLTVLSSHLFLYQQIIQWAWARKPYKVVWACRNDGTMLSLTYLKEQEVYGWARHDTQGLVVGVASISEPPVNAVYMIVQRFPPNAPQGIYIMERMDNRIWQSVEDAYAVDSGVSNPMVTPATFVSASAASGANVTFNAGASIFTVLNVGQILRMGGGIARITNCLSGKQVIGDWVLDASNSQLGFPYSPSGAWTLAANVQSLSAPHLAGMPVVGLADGVPIGPITVEADGTIPLPFPASNVKAGLGFTAQLQTPYLNQGQPTDQGRRKVIPAATVRLAASASGFQTGTDQPDGAAQNPPQIAPEWTNLAMTDTSQPGTVQPGANTYISPGGQKVTQLWTGDQRVVIPSDWRKPGQVAIQQTLPVALEILAVVPESLEGDTPEITYSQQPQRPPQPRGPGRWMLSPGGPRI